MKRKELPVFACLRMWLPMHAGGKRKALDTAPAVSVGNFLFDFRRLIVTAERIDTANEQLKTARGHDPNFNINASTNALHAAVYAADPGSERNA